MRNECSRVTRRRLMLETGGALTAALLPRRVAIAAEPAGRVITELSRYLAQAKVSTLPAHVIEKAKHHILDTLGAMVSGAELPPGRAAIRFAKSYGGEKIATVAASKVLCGPIEAALANGVLAHSDETDDSWPNGWHPGCNVIPAALAVGEQFGISGAHFLRAVTLGYDIGSRFLIALRPGVFQTHKSTHSIGGVFGAAAAAACAAGLNPQQMRWLIDYTAQQCSGIAAWDRDSEHIEKGFVFGGMPARSGVTAALLVHTGWTGVDDVLIRNRQLPRGKRAAWSSGSINRQTRRALRDHGHQYQKMDRRLTDSSTPGRLGNHAEEAFF